MDTWPVLLVLIIARSSSGQQQLCNVFQPFKVTPDNAKFVIGGPFPLHTEDCLHARPDIVQELIGVQWALSRWNQNPHNAQVKLALAAFDTCSRDQESLGQTMSFLRDNGFFNPTECRIVDGAKGRFPLGLIMPMAQDGRLKSLTDALRSIQVPLIASSGATAQALLDAQILSVFSTAPVLDHYMEAAIGFLKSIQSDLITLIYSDQHIAQATLDKQIAALSKSKISHSKATSITDPKSIDNNSSEILVVIASKDELINFFMTTPQLAGQNSKKLFVLLPALGERWSRDEIADFLLPKYAFYRLVIIQQGRLFIENDFRDYFLDILRNNYESYVLLATYMQQEHNCTLIGTEGMTDCENVGYDTMVKDFRMNRRVESAVLATYVYGALARHVAQDKEETCSTVGPACIKMILDFLKDKLSYTFGEADPPSYRGFVARFGPDRTLVSLPIEGLYASRGTDIRAESILSHTTGYPLDPSRVHSSGIRWSDGQAVRVGCQSWKPECQMCENKRRHASASDRLWVQKHADLYLLGLFDMRQSFDGDSSSCNRSIDDTKALAMPAAFTYALANVRKKYPQLNLLGGVELGAIIMDSCHDQLSTMETLIAASSDRCLVVGEPTASVTIPSRNIAAFASGQRGVAHHILKKVFQRQGDRRKSLIGSVFESWQSQPSGTQGVDPSFMPTYESQSKALIALLLRQGWDYVSVFLSEHDEDCVRAYESFRRLTESDGRICIADVVYARSGDRIESIRSASARVTRIAIAFTTAQDMTLILKTHQSYNGRSQDDSTRPFYVFVGDAHDWEVDAKQQSGARGWKSLALGALSIQFKKDTSEDFRNFVATLSPKKVTDKWFISFWEDYFKCSMRADKPEASPQKKACTGEERLPTDRFGGRMTRETYFMASIENFVIALDSFYKKMCPGHEGLCDAFFSQDYSSNVTDLMAKMEKPDQLTIYNYRPDVNNVNGGAYVEIGSWSSDGLKLNDTWTWYDSDRKANRTIPESTCKPPSCHCRREKEGSQKRHQLMSSANSGEQMESSGNSRAKSVDANEVVDEISEPNGGAAAAIATSGEWKKQLWTYIFLVINTILLLAAALVLTIVSVKLCCGIIKGNQSLGICLLFGVILLYGTAYFFIFDPCEILCRLRYMAHSFSYAVCFGVMIAKAVQLRNSESLGFNGYISYWNYWLLLFFIVAVQMALNVQWAIVRHPVVVSVINDAGTSSSTVVQRCSWNSDEFLASQIYVVVLLCMALFLALMNRNVKRNYKETRWLMYTAFICAAAWAIWMIGYAVTPDPFKDTVVVMELMTCATVVLCFMFGPKLYILLRFESMLTEGPSSRLPTGGPIYGAAETEKRNSIVLGSTKDDIGIHAFDGDDINEMDDGRRSVMSIGSVRSVATLSHTLSSAGSTTAGSDGSASPAYHAAVRKKSRGKRRGSGPASSESGSLGGDVDRRPPSTIFEETVSSAH